MNDTPHISIGAVAGGQNNIGKIEIAGDQIQNLATNAGDSQRAELVQAVLANVRNRLSNDSVTLDAKQWTQLEQAAIKAEQPSNETAIPDASNGDQDTPLLQTFVSVIRPHGKLIWKSLACFGRGALESLARTNPVINGIVEVCEMHMKDEPSS